jgi:hypothetical protein
MKAGRWVAGLGVALLIPACGNDGDDDDGSGGSAATAGTSTTAGNGGSAGTGGSTGGSAGSSAATGGGAGKGGAGASGAAGKAGSGGASGSASGGSAGRGGTSSGGRDPGLPPGSVGSGEVNCRFLPGTCPAGNVCCLYQFGGTTECVEDFDACVCSQPGNCNAIGCDGPEDCPGAVCCGTFNQQQADPVFSHTSCRASCDERLETVICKSNDDCPAESPVCDTTTLGYERCF